MGKTGTKTFDEDKTKVMLKKLVVLAYPDFKKPVDLCTDTSDLQLGAALVQEGKSIYFLHKKLDYAQMNHTVGEKELLDNHSFQSVQRNFMRSSSHSTYKPIESAIQDLIFSKNSVMWIIS